MTAFANYREDIVEELKDRFSEYPEVTPGKMFGHPGFKIMGRFFCFAYEDGVCVKLPPADYEAALELDEAEKFSPNDRPMGFWVVFTYPETEDYFNNWIWFEKAMAYIVTDEAAPPKKKKKQRKTD